MSSYCEILARQIGFSEQHCQLVRLASQLHDVGKVAVPDSILLKRGKLTPEEFEVIKGHAETGFQMLSGSASEVVQMGALIARTHHERWDGSGYPRGLAGEDIPAEGRIAAVADVFDALTSDRVYRSALPVKSAHQDDAGRTWPPLRPGAARSFSSGDARDRGHPAGLCRLSCTRAGYAPRCADDLCGTVPITQVLTGPIATVRAAGAQCLLDRAAELLERERLDQGGREHDAELGELWRGRGDARADDRQRWIDHARGLRGHGADGCCGLDHEHIRARQLLGGRHPDDDRLVAETGDHALQQSPDFIVGLADQYSCHVSMIGRARGISGGQTV